jgi:hypothetical protein
MKERLSEYTVHEHPRSGERIPGRRLQPGEKIHEDDRYDSSSGRWERASCPGLVIGEGCATYWVRSSATDNALDKKVEESSPVTTS